MEYVRLKSEITFHDLLVIASAFIDATGTLKKIDGSISEFPIVGVSDGRKAARRTLCFVEKISNPEVIGRLKDAFVITNHATSAELVGCSMLVVDDPRALFIDLLIQLGALPGFKCFTSSIANEPQVHPDAEVHPRAVVENGVFIGRGSKIGAGCVIKQGTYIGNNVIIRENTVVGCDGIALYKALDGRVLRFPHLAGVVIEDRVEIGASCVLPRGVLTSSRIGYETVIGNLSNVGHAVQIGAKVWMSVGCLIGGNSTIGNGSMLGLGVNVRDNLCIGQKCSIGMGSVVAKDLPDSSAVFGNPAKRLPAIKAGPER
jgi:UDP-3-O-[3-hydroxymyristoyl] glucosamine N-acyltransferase